MHDLLDIAEFTCHAVAPFLPEDSQVNPEVYGAELAFWLSRSLAAEGVVTTYPESEDWGWFLEYFTESGAEFQIRCGNVGGSKERWVIRIGRHARKLFGRDKPPWEEVSALVDGIVRVLQNDESVSQLELRWPS